MDAVPGGTGASAWLHITGHGTRERAWRERAAIARANKVKVTKTDYGLPKLQKYYGLQTYEITGGTEYGY